MRLSLRWQAFGDLLGRYGTVFRHAWRERSRLDTPFRTPPEAQFLPAALALQETPVSPAPRVTMGLLMTFCLLAVLWATFGEIDIVATASGRLVPNDRTKVVQPMETAAVRAIHVSDGQEVKAGDVLIELDDTAAHADILRLANDRVTARLQAAREKALLEAIEHDSPPRFEAPAGIELARVVQERRILDGQYGELRARLSQLDADISMREAELRTAREIVKKLEQTAPIARTRAEDFKALAGKNFVARHGYLEQEQVRIEQEADLATQRSRIQELGAALQETQRERTALIAQTRRASLNSLNEAEQQAVTSEQELLKAETRTRLMKLIAPVDGSVQQLAVHTVGGVVTPAQPLMMIVPKDNPLEVEAFVENKDIGFVASGQDAEIKVETFPFTKYGTIHGKIVQVSNDAIDDEKRGLIYSSRIHPERATMRVEGKIVNLSPGMSVTVEIKTGKRRVIEYFLSPLIQQAQESLHER